MLHRCRLFRLFGSRSFGSLLRHSRFALFSRCLLLYLTDSGLPDELFGEKTDQPRIYTVNNELSCMIRAGIHALCPFLAITGDTPVMVFLLDGIRKDISDALRREFLKDALNGGLRRKAVVAVVVVDGLLNRLFTVHVRLHRSTVSTQLTGFKGIHRSFPINRNRRIPQRRRGFLFFHGKPLFELFINTGDHLSRRFADGFQRAFQLLGLLVGGPTGDIAERIIRGFNAVPLADGIGDAFCLDLLSAPVFLVLGSNLFARSDGMELGMGNLVDRRLDGLDFTHTLLNGNAVFYMREVAFCAIGDVFKGNGDRRQLFESIKKGGVVFHAACQLVYGNIGKLFAVRLGHIEDAHHLEGGAGHFNRLSDRLAVLVENGLLRCWVEFFPLFLHLVGRRSKDFDALFALHHMAVEVALPCRVTGDQRRIRLLHGDEKRIVKRVVVEL